MAKELKNPSQDLFWASVVLVATKAATLSESFFKVGQAAFKSFMAVVLTLALIASLIPKAMIKVSTIVNIVFLFMFLYINSQDLHPGNSETDQDK